MGKSAVVKFGGSLSAEDWKCIREFKRRAAELLGCGLVKDGYDLSASMNWSIEKGFSCETKALPDEEPFRALLMTFRFFWAKKEPSNFIRVLSIIRRHSGNPTLHQLVDGLRVRWKQSLFGGLMFVHINEKPLTADHLLDLWLNSHYFHGDDEKRAALESISKMLSPELVKYSGPRI